jgi:hypothetical protein
VHFSDYYKYAFYASGFGGFIIWLTIYLLAAALQLLPTYILAKWTSLDKIE